MKPMYNDHDADDMKRMPAKGKKKMGSRMAKMAKKKGKKGMPYPTRASVA